MFSFFFFFYKLYILLGYLKKTITMVIRTKKWNLTSFTQHHVIPNLYEFIFSVEHNLINSRHFCPQKSRVIKNGLVTFYKILFCVQQKKSFGIKWWQNLLEVTFQQSSSKSMLYCQVFSMWQKCIIKFVVFVVNSVISINIHFISVLFYSFTQI